MKAIVLGAGATGLAVAYLLARGGASVTIVEAAPIAGGLLSTFDVGNGARLETYYHHFFTHDAEINWLLDELGLSSRIEFRPTTMGVLRNGNTYPFNGPKDLLGFDAISLAARVRFGLSSALLAYRKRYSDDEQQPALEWFGRWAGAEATEAIWEPLLRCKFGDAAERIPLAWMAGRLRQRARSRKGAGERLGYLRGSLQVLVDRLIQVLTGKRVDILLETKADSLTVRDGRATGIIAGGRAIEADVVVSTLPTTVLSRLVEPIQPQYAQALASIQYLGAICVILAMREPLSSTYWLNVADPDYDFGGIIEQTNFVPASEYGGLHIAYLSRYMEISNALWSMDDQMLVDRQIGQLSRWTGRDVKTTVKKSWVFRARHAAPLADIGFWKKIPSFRSPIDNLFVASMCHVYPDERSVNNSIRVAAALVATIGLDTGYVPTGMSLAARFGRSQTIGR